MKAYKIVSNEPIIGNSLVKIVMAPQNVLEKLSKRENSKEKYGFDKIDESGNVPIKNRSCDDDGFVDTSDGELSLCHGNVNVEVYSLDEGEGNVGLFKPAKLKTNVLHHQSNNIQVIAKSHKQPLISVDRKNLFDEAKEVTNDVNNMRDDIQPIDVNMEPMEINPEIVTIDTNLPASTTEPISVDSTNTEAEELLTNPTTSELLLQTPMPDDNKFEFAVEDIVSTETNSGNHQTSVNDLDNLPLTSVEFSTENNVPLVVLKILKNRTVLVEETHPQSAPDQLSVGTTLIPTYLPPVRPKKITRPSTTTQASITVAAKQPVFPKKTKLLDSFSKFKSSAVSKFDEMAPKTSLLDIETTPMPDATVKSKNIKRAVGDEGTFSNIVRPSPIRPKSIADLLPRETDAERTERLSKSLQRLMHFVTICGHVDSYMTKRFRHGLKNVARIFDSMEETRRRRSNL